jgi:tripartite-type tricarboxylate transporter receptor subunit TctC
MRKMVSRFLLVAFMLFIVASITGCGKTEAPAAKEKPKEKYPTRAITVFVNYGAGGSSDLGTRALMAVVEKDLGVPINVMNKPGAGGWIGWLELLKAKPDGYTISLINTPNLITGYMDPKQNRKENIDSFALIANHVTDPGAIAIRNDEKRFTNMKELVEYAKKNVVTTTSTGITGDDHIAALKFNKQYGTKFEAVHNRGANETITQVLGGHVDVMFANVGDVTTLHKNKEIKVLAVMSEKRSPLLAEIPTLKEIGYDGVYSWSARGFAAPKGTDPAVIAILTAAIERATKNPDHMKKMAEMGLTLDYQNPEGVYKSLKVEEQGVVGIKDLLGWK